MSTKNKLKLIRIKEDQRGMATLPSLAKTELAF